MQAVANVTTDSRMLVWLSYVVSAVPCLMLSFSAAMKIIQPAGIDEGFSFLGWPLELAMPLAVLELTCVVVYLIPRTAVFGAILVTGFLGGAVATHVRIGDAFLIQICLGGLAWLGIWLRDLRLRQLIPLQN